MGTSLRISSNQAGKIFEPLKEDWMKRCRFTLYLHGWHLFPNDNKLQHIDVNKSF